MDINLGLIKTDDLLNEIKRRKDFVERDLYLATLSIDELWQEFQCRFIAVSYVGRTSEEASYSPVIEFRWDVGGDALQVLPMLRHVEKFISGGMVMSERMELARDELNRSLEANDNKEEDVDDGGDVQH